MKINRCEYYTGMFDGCMLQCPRLGRLVYTYECTHFCNKPCKRGRALDWVRTVISFCGLKLRRGFAIGN